MMRVVVLGTGTAVGKTFVTAALTRALREQGLTAIALKPVETGFGDPERSDAHELEQASGITTPDHPRFRFADPVSPHLAARRAGVELDPITIARWCVETTAESARELLIVETAGGALSPLSDVSTNLDLARALEPATIVLVAPDALGVLHDVRATVIAMQATFRKPDLLVLTRSRPADASSGSNAAELERFGLPPCAVIGSDPARELLPLALAVANQRVGTQGL